MDELDLEQTQPCIVAFGKWRICYFASQARWILSEMAT